MYIYPSQAYSLFLKAHYFWGCTEGTSGPGLQTRLVLIKIYKGSRKEMGLYAQQSRYKNVYSNKTHDKIIQKMFF